MRKGGIHCIGLATVGGVLHDALAPGAGAPCCSRENAGRHTNWRERVLGRGAVVIGIAGLPVAGLAQQFITECPVR